jgi:hypothetical protein
MKLNHVAVAALMLTGCVRTPAAYQLKDLAQWPDDTDGTVYALPRTVFVVEAVGTAVTRKPAVCTPDEGSKNRIAKALGYDDWESAQKAHPPGRIVALKDAKLSTRVEADPAAVFVSTYKRRWLSDSLLKVELGPEGLLMKSSATTTDKILLSSLKTVEVGTKIAAAILPFVGGAAAVEVAPRRCSVEAFEAHKTALDERRKQLMLPNIPFPKDTLEFLLAELSVEEERLKGLYFGTTTVAKGPVSCEVTPTSDGEQPVLTLSREGGIKAAEGVRCVIPPELQHNGASSSATRNMTLRVTLIDSPLLKVQQTKPNAKVAGFYYRVPAVAEVSVTGIGSAEVPQGRHLIPQLGKIATLPRARGGSATLDVELHPDTGALKSVSIDRKGVDMVSSVDTIGTSIKTVLDAEKAHRDSADTLTTLKYNKAVLEAEIAIHDAREVQGSWDD